MQRVKVLQITMHQGGPYGGLQRGSVQKLGCAWHELTKVLLFMQVVFVRTGVSL